MNPLGNLYKTKDNKWIFLGMVQTDLFWHDFCKAMDLEGLEYDPRFDTHKKRCGEEYRRELISILDEAFLKRKAAEWQNRWKGTSLIYSVIKDFQEVVADPQLWANQYLIELDSRSQGKSRMIGFPIQFSETPMSLTRVCPARGQHTTQVLVDLLGYSSGRITELKERKVVQ